MEQPTVSAIIITYNRANFLKKSIESILNQTYHDFEILIVDDCSPDHTREIVEGFNDKRIKYFIHENNKGEGGSRNTGLQHARGKYIAFLDDDDEWLENKLQRQVSLLETASHEIGVVYTGLIRIDGKTDEIIDTNQIQKASGHILSNLIQGKNFVTPSTVMIKKECFESVGIFDEKLPTGFDYDMWIRIAKHYQFQYLNEPLVKYRIHSSQLSGNYQLQIKGREAMFAKYKDYFNEPNIHNSKRYFELGILHCLNGDHKSGRKMYTKSISLYPYNLKPPVAFLLTLLGNRNFQRFLQWINRKSGPA